jgi:hypothetical protein
MYLSTETGVASVCAHTWVRQEAITGTATKTSITSSRTLRHHHLLELLEKALTRSRYGIPSTSTLGRHNVH